MSFNTFCGQDPTNAATYNKVLAAFLPAAGGGGNPSVNTTNANAVVFPVLVAATGAAQQLLADDTATPISVNAATGDFIVVDTLKINQTDVALGKGAGAVGQAATAIAIGLNAGALNQAADAIAIGENAGNNTQGADAVAIGSFAGAATQGASSVAIGSNAGQTNQGGDSIAIGFQSGSLTQQSGSVAIGYQAGQTGQLINAVAIGVNAGQNTQGQSSVALGTSAGQTFQGANCIAIGNNAGSITQGANGIAIGQLAGQTGQAANTIVISATGVAVTGATASATYIAPIRGVATATPVIVYNTTTSEITYNTSSIKYKKNVIDLQQDTSNVYNIRAREYDSKDENKHYIGYIAEELNDVDTYFTWKNPDNTPEGIEWFNLLIYTIEEMKKLKQKNIEITNRIEQLEQQKPSTN